MKKTKSTAGIVRKNSRLLITVCVIISLAAAAALLKPVIAPEKDVASRLKSMETTAQQTNDAMNHLLTRYGANGEVYVSPKLKKTCDTWGDGGYASSPSHSLVCSVTNRAVGDTYIAFAPSQTPDIDKFFDEARTETKDLGYETKIVRHDNNEIRGLEGKKDDCRIWIEYTPVDEEDSKKLVPEALPLKAGISFSLDCNHIVLKNQPGSLKSGCKANYSQLVPKDYICY